MATQTIGAQTVEQDLVNLGLVSSERVTNVLARIGDTLLAFYNGLAGPPMSKRERLNLYLESTEVARRVGPSF